MKTQEHWESLQAKWRAASEKAHDLRFDLKYHYGDYMHGAPKAKRDKLESAYRQEQKASDRIFAWLEANSPRSWMTGVPASWVCGELTYADAITAGRLSIIPPCAYGSYPSDSLRFSQAVETQTA